MDKVESFTLVNQNNTSVVVLALGGIIQEFSIMNQGQRQNLVVNFEDANDYVTNPYQICKQIGRIAGRIKDGKFELDGKQVQVPANEGNNTLHGGEHGISTQIFEGYQVSDNEVVLSLNLKESKDGFPGGMTLMIDYLLHDDDRLDIQYDVTAMQATVFDPTVHIYWQLDQGLKNADLKINGDSLQEVDDEKIPTGNLNSVENTAFDFTKKRNLAEAINDLRNENHQKGFDNGYRVRPSMTNPVVELDETDKKVRIKVFSDRNGLVIFTADPKNADNDSQGIFNSLATEVQTLPDALHHSKFGEVRLNAGEHKTMKIAFQAETY